MKKHLLSALTIVILLLMPALTFAQPPLGTAKDYVLFSTNGAVSNSGVLAKLTGNVGTNLGSNTGFGNVDGVMTTSADASSAAVVTALLSANQWITDATVTNSTHGVTFGAVLPGETLPAGVYSVGAASNLDGILTLNGTSTDLFIFKIGGAFSVAAGAEIKLTGGATACNVFWQINGTVNMATGSKMKGTFIATNSAVTTMIGVTLEGRMLSIIGAITVDGITARIPIGCGSPNTSPTLTGPTFPTLASTECYVLFTTTGAMTNSNAAGLFTGNIGSNSAAPTGFVPGLITGTLHAVADASTAACAGDLGSVYTYLNTLNTDITLLSPLELGNDLVLTPHTYNMTAAATLSGDLYLNAQGNTNAVFVIKITGALSTAAGARVMLLNNAQAKNVFWKVTGAVTVAAGSTFRGTIVNTGDIGLGTTVTLEGRGMTIAGAVSTAGTSAIMPPGCVPTSVRPITEGNSEVAILYPNPFTTYTTILLNGATQDNSYELRVYNVLGKEVMNRRITQEVTPLETSNLPAGIYFYKMIGKDKSVKSGKLVSQQ